MVPKHPNVSHETRLSNTSYLRDIKEMRIEIRSDPI